MNFRETTMTPVLTHSGDPPDPPYQNESFWTVCGLLFFKSTSSYRSRATKVEAPVTCLWCVAEKSQI